MKKLTVKAIQKLQRENGFEEIQNNINSGLAWKLEGSYGRAAMRLLESGACMLPLVPRMDYYGNKVPSRKQLVDGTKGTYQNSVNFWQGFLDETIIIDDFLDVSDIVD